ncbi:MAG: glyoxalase/bleomycin resistance/extradiol dioxygenase family protein [Verrucomicrobiaceae bacterium]|nr:glyoxalase/bleomycin resistance/extradiol dioxygenase family protein [Verrucomicrobiaceae bacterium]
MTTQIFINLPIADLPRSLAFYKALGFSHNPQFSDDTGACIVINEHIHVMVLTHPKFLQFTSKVICDTAKAIEVLNCLSCESREKVDELVAKAVAAGGSTYAEPKDYGFMYQHSFADPDGHCWELFQMSEMPPKE